MWSKIYIGLHVMFPLFLSFNNETNFLNRFSKESSYIKFYENLSSGSQVVCEQREGRTYDEAKLVFKL